MIALIIISVALAISLGITLYKNYNLFFKHKDLKEIYEKLYKDVNDEYNKLILTQGFYTYTITFKGFTYPAYVCTVYVSEIERYKNGYSKIKLDDISVVGYEMKYFGLAKTKIIEQFTSVVKTNYVTWLQVGNTRQDRINKLKRLIK